MKSILRPAFLLSMLLAALSGCQRTETPSAQGPAEQVGQKLDQAAVKATESLNKLAEKAGASMEKVGENLQNAAREAEAKNEAKK
ncbi:MAG: hypothetical protein ABWY05_10150 [Noviherbaspirillum sp.]